MVFNDTSGLDGLIQECERITGLGTAGISGVTNKLKDFTARLNQAIDDFYTIALRYDKKWTFDDYNKYESDGSTERKLPIARTDIVSGQQDYKFAIELLNVKNGIFVADSSGNFTQLTEETDPQNAFLLPGNSGVPTKFRLIGNSILFDAIPNYNYTNGIKIPFTRTGSKFVYTDTTKIPGIPVLFHKWLARDASLPYLIEKQLPQKNDIAALISKGEEDIKNFIANRNMTSKPHLSVKQESNK